MKPTFKYVLVALIGVVSVYTACKKSVSSSISINTADLSKQIAVSLYKSLSGQYGGANITDGIKAPASLTPARKGPSINSTSPFCGYTIDTTYSTSQTSGDTVKVYGGHFKFTYGCTTTVLDSYLLADSITNTENGPTFENIYKLQQNYFVKALDQTYKISSVEGYIGNSFHTRSIAAGITTQYHNMDSQYGLTGVKVDVTSGTADVISGTATFTAQLQDLDPTTPPDGYFGGFTGTIAFMGGHIAKVSIHVSGTVKLYTVNMLTGTVSEG